MGFPRDALSADEFLGGRLILLQPRRGYRAGVDPIFLAAAVNAHPGQSVLELGCGAGAALLSLGRRVGRLHLVGVEMQPDYANLARRNAVENNLKAEVHVADLNDLPAAVRAASFDHVIMNPPYHQRDGGSAAPDPGREIARAGGTPLGDWIATATRRLKPRGYLTLIQKAERLPEVLAGLDARMGSVVVKPLIGRAGRAASLVLVQARKGGRGAFRLAAPLILHDGPDHVRDGESYRQDVRAILRDGDALPLR